jgi:hypothetical protein
MKGTFKGHVRDMYGKMKRQLKETFDKLVRSSKITGGWGVIESIY